MASVYGAVVSVCASVVCWLWLVLASLYSETGCWYLMIVQLGTGFSLLGRWVLASVFGAVGCCLLFMVQLVVDFGLWCNWVLV